MTQLLHTQFQSGIQRYPNARPVSESLARYVRQPAGTTIAARQFRLTKVSVVELSHIMAESVDAVETIVGVEGKAMDVAHEANLRVFLVGMASMVAGALAAITAPSLAAPWLTNVGLIVLSIGAFIAAGASERYRRG